MKKDIKSTDKISEGTLHEILLDIKYRLDHLEDIEADNRALIVKLVKQGNSIVKFLSTVALEEEVEVDTKKIGFPNFDEETIDKNINSKRMKQLQELIDEFMDKRRDLKELEDELKKHKEMLTPGQGCQVDGKHGKLSRE